MASGKEYLNYILEQLSELDGITYRAMMGEYILYYGGKEMLLVDDVEDRSFLRKLVEAMYDELPASAKKK